MIHSSWFMFLCLFSIRDSKLRINLSRRCRLVSSKQTWRESWQNRAAWKAPNVPSHWQNCTKIKSGQTNPSVLRGSFVRMSLSTRLLFNIQHDYCPMWATVYWTMSAGDREIVSSSFWLRKLNQFGSERTALVSLCFDGAIMWFRPLICISVDVFVFKKSVSIKSLTFSNSGLCVWVWSDFDWQSDNQQYLITY